MATPNHIIPYQQLDKGKTQIRFVRFRSLLESDPIELHLETSTLDADSPPYIALSYEWGDPKVTERITLDGHEKDVTTNLYAALCQIRLYAKMIGANTVDWRLWIDALCINQEDDVEKNHQVAIMGDIYSHAHCVIMWLGHEDSHSCAAIAFVKRWVELLRRNTEMGAVLEELIPGNEAKLKSRLEDDNSKQRLRDAILHQVQEAGSEQFLGPEDLAALYFFLRRGYWRRSWILQEQLLAREARIFCGPEILDVYDFWVVRLVLSLMRFSDHIPSRIRYQLRELDILGRSFFAINLMSIRCENNSCRLWYLYNFLGNPFELEEDDCGCSEVWNLVKHNVNFESTNPSDKIYAIFGLVNKSERLIEIDYSVDSAAVYTRYWKAELSRMDSLDLLGWGRLTHWHEDIGRLPGLPSWVPDFRQSSRLPAKSSRACGNTKRPLIVWSEDDRAVTLPGVFCDEIRQTYVIQPDDRDLKEGLWDLVIHIFFEDLIEDLMKYMVASNQEHEQISLPLASSCLKPDGVSWLEIMYRTLMKDMMAHSGSKVSTSPSKQRLDVSEITVLISWVVERVVLEGLDRNASLMQRPFSIKAIEQSPGEPSTPDATKRQTQAVVAFLAKTVFKEKWKEVPRRNLAFDSLEEHRKSVDSFQEFLFYLFQKTGKSMIVRSRKGYIGHIFAPVLVGDMVCVVPSCPHPLILRPVAADGSGNKFMLVGWAYFYGMMQGEAVEVLPDGKLAGAVDICLV